MYVHPTWYGGLLQILSIYLIPFLVILGVIVYGFIKDSEKMFFGGIVCLFAFLFVGAIASDFVCYELFEVPSVDEKVITVSEWQPRVGISTDNGVMSITRADDLMLVDTEGNCYYNTENFWFQKFETRDIFNQLKVNGTYRIKYYGWREGFNNGFPNILSVEEVIDETNTTVPKYSDYFGTKLVN